MAALVALFISLVLFISGSSAVYYGAEIGDFANRFHQIKGKVYAVDSRTIFIKVRNLQTMTISQIHSGYTSSEQLVQAPNSSVQCCLAMPKWL